MGQVLKNGPSKNCGKQSLKSLKWYWSAYPKYMWKYMGQSFQ